MQPTKNVSEVDVLVIGAGPTGLGAAKRLHQIVCLEKEKLSNPVSD
jgi:cation diffusion facilitator CzcD-associated flavoprotein CzcO